MSASQPWRGIYKYIYKDYSPVASPIEVNAVRTKTAKSSVEIIPEPLKSKISNKVPMRTVSFTNSDSAKSTKVLRMTSMFTRPEVFLACSAMRTRA